MKPKVLIATTERWYPTARLGMALAQAGCVVQAVCPSDHPLSKTRAVKQTYPYNGLSPVKSFAEAITLANPDFIVPSDDLATHHLHEVHARMEEESPAGTAMRALVERSLGARESFPVVTVRANFIELARQIGVRVPRTEIVKNVEELEDWASRTGFPTVLKADGTSGGVGVNVVKTIEEATRSLRKLQSPPLLARAAKRALANKDTNLVWPSLLRKKPAVIAQTFIVGREATSAVFCWEGRVLASLHFEVVSKVRATGHATVVHWVENREMSGAVEKIAHRLCLSGLHGFDFVIEAATGDAYLIEMNPRATQVGHLSLGSGHDLPAALYAALTNQAVQTSPRTTENETIALFPQEWLRDPESAYLTTAYHDVPWDEPKLVEDCLRKQEHKINSNFHSTWVQAKASLASSQPYAATVDCKTE